MDTMFRNVSFTFNCSIYVRLHWRVPVHGRPFFFVSGNRSLNINSFNLLVLFRFCLNFLNRTFFENGRDMPKCSVTFFMYNCSA